MAIPHYQAIMLPLLEMAGDQKEHSLREAVSHLAERFGLTEAEQKELLPSGKQATFHNRVGWAKTYLEKARLIEKPRRAHFRITDRGLKVLRKNPPEINVRYLHEFDEFVEFRQLRHDKEETEQKEKQEEQVSSETPEEALETAHQILKEGLSAEILEAIKGCPPEFFERLVVDLLVRMGYGGSRKEAGQALGRSGDGGIDGTIKEDRLGLDIIYVQAKRWEGVVGRPEIQKFAGALQGCRARKGIFLSTSSFTREALEYVQHIESKIILIDGARVADLMIEHNVGVTPLVSYEVKRLDSDYFAED